MEQPPPGPTPTDPYQWRESVLSTRSLSYISMVHDDTNGPSSPRSRVTMMRNSSFTFPNFNHTRRNTLMSISSLGEDEDEETLEIGGRRRRSDIAEHAEDAIQGSLIPAYGDGPRCQSPSQEEKEMIPGSIANSPLFCLPRELRQLIWSYALSPSDPDVAIPWPSTHLSSHLQPQLLRTCRVIYEESVEILYTTTNLSFGHPSDANMFRRALASQAYAMLLPHFTLQIKSTDAKLWTGWFNSNSQERSLVKDYPNLQSITIRYQGLRYDRRFTEEQNAHLWLKDSKLQEVVLSVRKCNISARGGPPVVRVALCVVLPDDIQKNIEGGKIDGRQAAEKANCVIFVREAWLLGCFIRVEAVEKDAH